MAFKLIILAAFAATASAGHLGGHLSYAAPAYAAAPIAQAVLTETVDEHYDPHPQYSFAYDVKDGLTGDSKSQHESRDGDVVKGSYSLLEADGTRRTVDYTADSVNGFNAVVHKEPSHVAFKTVHVAPVVHAAPTLIKTVAPAQATISKYSTSVDYSAPVVHVAQYSAPAYVQVAAPAAAGW